MHPEPTHERMGTNWCYVDIAVLSVLCAIPADQYVHDPLMLQICFGEFGVSSTHRRIRSAGRQFRILNKATIIIIISQLDLSFMYIEWRWSNFNRSKDTVYNDLIVNSLKLVTRSSSNNHFVFFEERIFVENATSGFR